MRVLLASDAATSHPTWFDDEFDDYREVDGVLYPFEARPSSSRPVRNSCSA